MIGTMSCVSNELSKFTAIACLIDVLVFLCAKESYFCMPTENSMTELTTANFRYIIAAIAYLKSPMKNRSSVAEIAAGVGLSPVQLQEVVATWGGMSADDFFREARGGYMQRIGHATEGLAFYPPSTVAYHDRFIEITEMKVDSIGARDLVIDYSFNTTLFGDIIVASVSEGICYLAFHDDSAAALQALHVRFPWATLRYQDAPCHREVRQVFSPRPRKTTRINLHVCGTDFQVDVWKKILNIPAGCLSTYGEIARSISHPCAARAVGTAIGRNPVAFLIPCHRVVQSSGGIGGYMWGISRKTALIAWEGFRRE